ncbi:hypothetical protein DHEL01_v202852 [Diaporthe helianthi]|uniref:Uncharacterized protein n=1 Tax=Diaporthe helianthi TaxID=158607 RepID=A0A2P5I8C2_DIAHE|nr:hypothetical protein DHEL01_v202852 [Diaporthe helianthi]
MEGCPNKFVHLVDCCLGRRKNQEPIELTPPRRNTYGQKLKHNLEHRERKNETIISNANVSRPLPVRSPLGRASLDLGKPQRASADLSDLVGSDAEDASVPHKYDRAWYEFLGSLHNALKHTKYSISGRMGMSVWGCSIGAKTGMSIVCPIESRQAVKLWCISSSGRFSLTESEPDILTFQSPGPANGRSRVWRIRIRWLREVSFEAMPKVEMALRYDDGNPFVGEQVAEVNVLTLPCLLDNCASAWVDHIRKVGDVDVNDRRIRGIEDDIFSILERVMDLNFTEQGSGPLNQHECRHVARASFWEPFTKKHPGSPAMFALGGLPLPQVLTTTTTTTNQPGPHADMAYLKDNRFSDPRPAPAVPPKDTGRDLTTNAKKQSDTEPQPKSPLRVPFLDLFNSSSSSGRKKESRGSKAMAERQRRQSDDARKLEEQVSRGARRMEERERERRRAGSRSEKRDSNGSGKGKEERESSRRDGNTPRSSLSYPPRSGSASRYRSGSGAGYVTLPDGTKVSSFDPSSLERSASGRGRIPARGHFADLFIVDDGEAL